MMGAQFASKQALVIGGSRGIGAAVVRRLVHEGAAVAFTYVESETAASQLARDTGARAIRVDSTDRDALAAVIEAQGSLDILVVSAGVLVTGDPVELDTEAVDHMLELNVHAPYHAAVEASRNMQRGGRIILIGSTNAERIPVTGGAAYALTKSALQGLARGLARDLGDREITVNVVQPGPTDTDMNPAAAPHATALHRFMAIKRHVKPDEVAAFVAFLAGPDAAMITGSMQTIDGGYAA